MNLSFFFLHILQSDFGILGEFFLYTLMQSHTFAGFPPCEITTVALYLGEKVV